VGAVGLDIHLADLVEDFTYFNVPGGRSYVFLIDSIGNDILLLTCRIEREITTLYLNRDGTDASFISSTEHGL
jgi:hypothetical protein